MAGALDRCQDRKIVTTARGGRGGKGSIACNRLVEVVPGPHFQMILSTASPAADFVVVGSDRGSHEVDPGDPEIGGHAKRGAEVSCKGWFDEDERCDRHDADIIARMIIPYGHETKRVQGLPWVTIVIFVLCLAVFVLTLGASSRFARESEVLFSEITETYLAQPELALNPELEEILFQRLGVDENQRDVFLQSVAAAAPGRGDVTTQQEFDALSQRFWSVYKASPHYRFGVVPREMSPVNLVTYQFLHGGWGHLLGNLLFLYLAAPIIEDRWGRTLFLTFYLLAGVVAALFWAFRYPELNVPLVGASGSIAGVMGAFLICFGTSKIRFFYWFFIIWGTFEAPAWLMLPLWLIMEVISGRTMDVLSQGDGGGGVAHWAHVWGFIFGMAFAWVIGVFGLGQRLAERSTAQTAESSGGSRLERAPRQNQRSDAVSMPANLISDTTPDIARRPSEKRRQEIDETAGSSVELRPAERLRLVEVVPRSLDGTSLVYEVMQGNRRIDLSSIEAVGGGAVAGEGKPPFLIVDLLLDSPSDRSGDLRVLRFRSTSFDPRSLVGGDDVMAAFLHLLKRILSASGALPLPDEATIQAPSRRSYSSIEEYQQRVLGVMG